MYLKLFILFDEEIKSRSTNCEMRTVDIHPVTRQIKTPVLGTYLNEEFTKIEQTELLQFVQ